MIASLAGTVEALEAGAVVLEVGGVGYLVHVPVSVLSGLAVGRRGRLLTHLAVREDALTLYGFATVDQREAFRALVGVTGVGPRLALAVLSALEPDALRRVVATGDVGALTDVPGIGKRTAERMVLELKQRLGPPAEHLVVAAGSAIAEVREALIGLGYAPAEFRPVLDRVAGAGTSVEEMLRWALRELAVR
jgi:holliday junction DNA helicase RuvA